MIDRDILADKLDFTYKKQDDVGEVRQLLAVIANYWYLFVGGVLVSLLVGFLVIQYTPKQWNVMGKIIIEDEKNSPSKLLSNGVSSDLSSLFDIKSNSYNEVRVLESRNLLRRVITQMNINVHLYDKSGLMKKELLIMRHLILPFQITT